MLPGAPGLWVNRAFAERFFQGHEPIGALVRLGGTPITHEVAGVVGNARYQSIRVDIQPTVYVPSRADANYFLLRTAILRRLEPTVVDGLLETHDAAGRLAELAAEGALRRASLPQPRAGPAAWPRA